MDIKQTIMSVVQAISPFASITFNQSGTTIKATISIDDIFTVVELKEHYAKARVEKFFKEEAFTWNCGEVMTLAEMDSYLFENFSKKGD